MKLQYSLQGQTYVFDIDGIVDGPGIITIGQKCKHVWNALAIDDPSVDPFQCHLIGAVGGPWKLNHGQQRTECPKGLISSRVVPCNGCMGRCVNITPGRPKYYLRTPETQTLINGAPVGKWGTELHVGDTLTLGEVMLSVVE